MTDVTDVLLMSSNETLDELLLCFFFLPFLLLQHPYACQALTVMTRQKPLRRLLTTADPDPPPSSQTPPQSRMKEMPEERYNQLFAFKIAKS